MAFLPEFLNNNAHRYYPFDPDGNNRVPPALILDMGIIATSDLPDNSDDDTTYISQIVTDGTHVRFYLSMQLGNNEPVDFGCVATADANYTPHNPNQPFQRIDLSPIRYADENINVVAEGFIILGDLGVLQKMPPTLTMEAEEGRIYTGCIQHMTQWLAGFRVGNQILGGVVTLNPGPGVELSVNDNTLTISCTGTVPPGNDVIVDDATLLSELEVVYGTPITSINGVSTGGDWQLVTVDKEGLVVQAPNSETSSITINNTLASACCSQDQIKYIVDNIAAINERVGVITSFQTQLDTNLNILSAQMSKIT